MLTCANPLPHSILSNLIKSEVPFEDFSTTISLTEGIFPIPELLVGGESLTVVPFWTIASLVSKRSSVMTSNADVITLVPSIGVEDSIVLTLVILGYSTVVSLDEGILTLVSFGGKVSIAVSLVENGLSTMISLSSKVLSMGSLDDKFLTAVSLDEKESLVSPTVAVLVGERLWSELFSTEVGGSSTSDSSVDPLLARYMRKMNSVLRNSGI